MEGAPVANESGFMIRRVDAAEVILKSKTLESITMFGLRRPPKSTFAVQVIGNDNLCHIWVKLKLPSIFISYLVRSPFGGL